MQRFAIGLTAIGGLLLAGAADRVAAQPAPQQVQQIAETHWIGQTSRDGPFPEADSWTLYFRSDGVLVYSAGGESHDNARWRQRDRLVTFGTNDYYAVAVGAVRGDVIEGVAYNIDGNQTTWTFRRLPADSVEPAACPANMVAMRGMAAPLVCICPPNIAFATVWGDETAYTDDSHICTAAVHAGVVSAQEGGVIDVTPQPGRESYPGSTANGVTTLQYGSWQASYILSATRAK